ncbi:MAG: hypothetical protein ACOX52_18720 [Verrucomicrobiota bacterium]
MDRANFAAEWCHHRNNTVAVPGFLCPNPITRPFDTDTDSDPDPDLASPWTVSDGHYLDGNSHSSEKSTRLLWGSQTQHHTIRLSEQREPQPFPPSPNLQ